MITYNILAGTTDVSVVLRAIDSTDGTPETAFDHATAGIDLQYRREGGANVAITEVALAALTTAHTDGGVEQIGNGYVRLDLPDASCAAGVSGVLVHGVATGMVIIGCYINLTPAPVDLRTWLGSAPNALVSSRVDASAGAMASGVLTAAAIAADAITDAKVASDVTIASVTGAVGSVTGLTNATIADAVLDEDMTAHQTQGTLGQAIGDPVADTDTIWGLVNTNLNATVASRASQTSVDTIDDFIDTEIAAIKAKTDLIPGTIDGKTFSEIVTLTAAVLLGKASGLATTTAVFRAADDSKDRVTATVDADGNRSAVTLDAA